MGRIFTGINSYLNRNTVFGLTVNISAYCWVFLGSRSLNGAFIKIGNSTTGFGLGVGNTTFDDAGNNIIGLYENVTWRASTTQIGTGWHFVGMETYFNGSQFMDLIIDETRVYNVGGFAPNNPSSSSGIGGYGTRYIKSSISDVQIFNTAPLSPAQRLQIKNEPGSLLANLVSYVECTGETRYEVDTAYKNRGLWQAIGSTGYDENYPPIKKYKRLGKKLRHPRLFNTGPPPPTTGTLLEYPGTDGFRSRGDLVGGMKG